MCGDIRREGSNKKRVNLKIGGKCDKSIVRGASERANTSGKKRNIEEIYIYFCEVGGGSIFLIFFIGTYVCVGLIFEGGTTTRALCTVIVETGGLLLVIVSLVFGLVLAVSCQVLFLVI